MPKIIKDQEANRLKKKLIAVDNAIPSLKWSFYRAPEPWDIMWQNLGVDYKNMAKRLACTWAVTFITWAVTAVVFKITGDMKKEAKATTKSLTVSNKEREDAARLSLIVGLIINVVNEI